MHEEILETFRKFQEGYTVRNSEKIDEFMDIFSNEEDVQMIGIGATVPGAYEWFTGKDKIKEIIVSDWDFWGDVTFDLENIRITEKNGTAWFSLCALLTQIETSEENWEFYLKQMKTLLEEGQEKADQAQTSTKRSAADRMFEAAHFGVRRVRERNLGTGYKWPMVLTGALIKEEIWRFHTLHWSMPVD